MSPSGGKRKGAGRPVVNPDAEKHTIRIRPEIWNWLRSDGDASKRITELVRAEMEKGSKEG